MRIMFLHHSTGYVVWMGSTSKIGAKVFGKSAVGSWFSDYNKRNGTSYRIEQMNSPRPAGAYPVELRYGIWNSSSLRAPPRSPIRVRRAPEQPTPALQVLDPHRDADRD